MLDRIIVAFDGSDLSREAFAYAVMIASKAKAGVLMLHVIEPEAAVIVPDPAVAMDPMAPVIGMDLQDEQAARADADAWFTDLGRYAEEQGVAHSGRCERGSVVDSLTHEAHARDMIAVGLSGRFKRGGIGSSTKDLVTHSGCPVLVASGPLRQINRVLVAYDGTGVSVRALEFGRSLAKATGWPLTVFALGRGTVDRDAALDQAEALAPDAQIIALNDTDGKNEADRIVEAANKDHYAILVTGAYADTWQRELLFGSTTAKVLRRLEGPAILVHEWEEDEVADSA